ncbi:MAG: hypothetical protein R8M45_07570, partial [Ghiorsea sp.]
GSLAIDAGSLLVGGAAFITTNPYAQSTTSDVATLDLGYHHVGVAPAFAVSMTKSTATPSLSYPSPNTIVMLTITPKDINGTLLGTGLNISVSLAHPLVSGETLSAVTDNNDGTYSVNFTAGAATGACVDSNNVIITVEGVEVKGKPSLVWATCA